MNLRPKRNPFLAFEEEAFVSGFQFVAGIDEAGRGPLAGPVVAAACIFPRGYVIKGIDDSKKLQPKERERLCEVLLKDASIIKAHAVVSCGTIDAINVLQATLEAMRLAVLGLSMAPDYLLVDGTKLPKTGIPSKAIVDGDARSQSIAAASIIAKCKRDEIMMDYHKIWPEYGFNSHKGYGTKEHLLSLDKYGPCPIHRISFQPVQEVRFAS